MVVTAMIYCAISLPKSTVLWYSESLIIYFPNILASIKMHLYFLYRCGAKKRKRNLVCGIQSVLQRSCAGEALPPPPLA